MHPTLYKAAANGCVRQLESVANADTQLLLSKAPQEITALHVAARLGHARFTERILRLRSELLKMQNSDDDTALHCAARAGYLRVVQILMDLEKEEGGSSSSVGLLKLWNKEGDTALHVALKNRQEDVAIQMVRADPRLPFALNYANESSFLVAAREEMVGVVKEILVGDSTNEGQQADSVSNSTSSDNTVIRINALPLTAEEKMELVSIQDNNGRTALHYAAWRNNAKIVRMILETDSRHVPFMVEKNGYSPLHVAVAFGRRRSMSELLKHCPETIEQVDPSGRNVLHIALLERKSGIIRRLLKEPDIGGLLDDRDKEGKTPFHLASEPDTRNVSVTTKRRKLARRNEEYGQKAPTKLSYVLRSRPQQMPDLTPGKRISLEEMKDQNQLFVVVASLIATVTFSAAFTLPGGYRSSNEPNPGTAILVSKLAFKAFLLFDTLAMCCSIWAIFFYMSAWGPINVQKKPRRGVHVLFTGNRFTLIACICMLIAFSAGVFVVIEHEYMWLAITVTAISCSMPIAFAAGIIYGLIYTGWVKRPL